MDIVKKYTYLGGDKHEKMNPLIRKVFVKKNIYHKDGYLS
jgi:hypothetical protein